MNMRLYDCVGYLFCLLLFFSCQQGRDQKKIKIGFSQCTGGDAWRRQMFVAMQGELSFHPDFNGYEWQSFAEQEVGYCTV